MSKQLFWALIISFILFIFIPFPLNIILCFIVGFVAPWIPANKKNDNDKNV